MTKSEIQALIAAAPKTTEEMIANRQAWLAKGAPGAPGLTVVLETVYADGSYTALVKHYGKEFSVHFVNGALNVYGVAGVHHVAPWKMKASVKAVKAWAAGQIKAQGPEFIAAHKALYGIEEVTL
jgi:hypothetical protein